MARCVDADKLLEYLEKEAESEDVKYSFIGAGVQATISVIKTFPTADVVPVVHAHWIETEDLAGNHYINCPICNYDFWLEGESAEQSELFYCPRCGARMDGEKE